MNPSLQAFKRVTVTACAALLLSACGPEQDDLEAYIKSVNARTSTAIEPIPQVLIYEPYLYSQVNGTDPFVPFAGFAAATQQASSSNELRPDFNRNREPLEQYPLEGLRMRGTLEFRDDLYALIESPEGVVFKVQSGSYMGQNFGRVVQITDAEIMLEEIVPDGLGGYVKRDATVALSGEDS